MKVCIGCNTLLRMHKAGRASERSLDKPGVMLQESAAQEVDKLKQDLHTAQEALSQAQADTSASGGAASNKLAALEHSLQSAQEMAAASAAKMADWECSAAQAQQAAGHLETAHGQIQQLHTSLKHAQGQAEAAEGSRRATVQVGASSSTSLSMDPCHVLTALPGKARGVLHMV